jgi:capsid assembly protease
MGEDAVRGTEAQTYDAAESISIGFADRIGELEEEMANFENEAAEMENMQMTQTPQNAPAAGTENTITPEALQAAVATARSESATAERGRIQAVLESEPAKTRQSSATKLAFNPKLASLSSADLIEMLADLPEDKASASTPAPVTPAKPAALTPFEQAMGTSGNPQIGAEAEGSETLDANAEVNSILAAFSKVTGRPRKTA